MLHRIQYCTMYNVLCTETRRFLYTVQGTVGEKGKARSKVKTLKTEIFVNIQQRERES